MNNGIFFDHPLEYLSFTLISNAQIDFFKLNLF